MTEAEGKNKKKFPVRCKGLYILYCLHFTFIVQIIFLKILNNLFQFLFSVDACKGKQSWPGLVGYKGKDAAHIIEDENHRVVIIVIIVIGTNVSDDFRCDRVRIWVNKRGVVVRVPQVG